MATSFYSEEELQQMGFAHLGHDEFMRIKMGVGEKPAGYDLADYVLGHLTGMERKVMDEAAAEAADAIRVIMKEGAESAMNRFNGKK